MDSMSLNQLIKQLQAIKASLPSGMDAEVEVTGLYGSSAGVDEVVLDQPRTEACSCCGTMVEKRMVYLVTSISTG